jgi:hypothetical protein
MDRPARARRSGFARRRHRAASRSYSADVNGKSGVVSSSIDRLGMHRWRPSARAQSFCPASTLLRLKRRVRNTIKNHRYTPRVLRRGVAVGPWTSSGSNGQWRRCATPLVHGSLQASILILTWAALDYPCAEQLDKDFIMPLCDHTPYRPLPAGADHIRMFKSHVNKLLLGWRPIPRQGSPA